MSKIALKFSRSRIGSRAGAIEFLRTGIRDGLNSPTRIWEAGAIEPRHYHSGGIGSDWAAIGRDIRSAMTEWKRNGKA